MEEVDIRALSEALEGATGPQKAPESHRAKKREKTLSVSLSASVAACGPLGIIGDDLFEQVMRELWVTERGRKESRRTGAIILGGGLKPMFRDPEARASYVYKNIVGLVWPCALSEMERRRLENGFRNGWATGDLAFLAEVPFGDLR